MAGGKHPRWTMSPTHETTCAILKFASRRSRSREDAKPFSNYSISRCLPGYPVDFMAGPKTSHVESDQSSHHFEPVFMALRNL
jgi:hypothetical protein